MTSHEEIPKVAIEPLDCLGKAKTLIGDQYWLFFGICLIVVLIVGSVPIILQGPLYCGIALCFIGRERGERVPFERLFKGFDVFLESFIATLIYVGIVLVLSLPFLGAMLACFIGGAAAMDERNEGLGITLFVLGGGIALVFTFACFAVNVFFAFTYPLIVDRKLGAIDALRTSMEAGRRNFWGLMGLTLLIALISIVLAAACYLPLFFFLPISFGSFFVAYRKVFPAQPFVDGRDEDGPQVEVIVPEVV